MARRDEILSAATGLLVSGGYGAMSLDAVCEAAACSKSSVYAHFGNKDGLLAALISEAAGSFAGALHALHLPGLDVAGALHAFSLQLLERALEPRHVALLRAAIAATAQQPKSGRQYADTALATTRTALAQFFAAKTASGELAVSEPDAAAAEFLGSLVAWPLLNAVLSGTSVDGARNAEETAARAVRSFMDAGNGRMR